MRMSANPKATKCVLFLPRFCPSFLATIRRFRESAEHSLQSTAIREQCEKQLRQRLQVSAAKLVAAEAEVEELREVRGVPQTGLFFKHDALIKNARAHPRGCDRPDAALKTLLGATERMC